MLTLILANWRTIATVLATLSLSYTLHRLDVYRLEDRHRIALAQQAVSIQADCTANQAINERTLFHAQTALAAINRKYDATRVRPNACIPLRFPPPPSSPDGSASRGGLPGQNPGIDTDILNAIGRDANEVKQRALDWIYWGKQICERYPCDDLPPAPTN